MVERVRLNFHEKKKSKSKSMALAPTAWSLFGKPLLLQGEDAVAYDELLARVHTAVVSHDIIDEMLINDVMSLEWDVLRGRRLKFEFIRGRGLKALEAFLRTLVPYHLYMDSFADKLDDDLKQYLPEGEDEHFASTLAHDYVRNEPDAVNEVRQVIDSSRLRDISQYARAGKARELVQAYAQREEDIVKLVDDLLASVGTNMDSLTIEALFEEFEKLERIDQLIALAESRRNSALREIERRHAVLAERLRQSVQQIEDGQFEVIETMPAEGTDAA